MLGRSTDWLLGIAGGLLLALMINYNSLLAKYTTPTYASWVAHGLGAAAALLLVMLHKGLTGSKTGKPQDEKTPVPLWFYLGGVPGAFTVILPAITVNSSLALSGTIALMLVGQIFFAIASDYFGWFGTTKRRLVLGDLFVALAVLIGSALIIFGGA